MYSYTRMKSPCFWIACVAFAVNVVLVFHVTSTTHLYAAGTEKSATHNNCTSQNVSIGDDISDSVRTVEKQAISSSASYDSYDFNLRQETRDDLSNSSNELPNLPIYAVSLFKSGTTSMHRFFECGGMSSVHYAYKRVILGECVRDRQQKGKTPLLDCWSEQGRKFDVFHEGSTLPKDCYDPAVWALEALYDSYPNMTFLLARRNLDEWFESITYQRVYPDELLQCRNLWPVQPVYRPDELIPVKSHRTNRTEVLPHQTLNPQDLKLLYQWHTEHVRQFVREHPSITLVEVELGSNTIALELEAAFGINARCWGHSNNTPQYAKSQRRDNSTIAH